MICVNIVMVSLTMDLCVWQERKPLMLIRGCITLIFNVEILVKKSFRFFGDLDQKD